MRQAVRGAVAVVLWAVASWPAAAEEFVLEVPGTTVRSAARWEGEILRIVDERGTETRYRRDPRFDSVDGRMLGFVSDRAGQILRWPVTGIGVMQIGVVTAEGDVRYRESKMRIRPVGRRNLPPPAAVAAPGVAGGGGLALLPQRAAEPFVLSTADAELAGLWLDVDRQGTAVMRPAAPGAERPWLLTPAGGDLYRLQTLLGDQPVSLSAASPTGPIHVERIAGDPRQLWRLDAAADQVRIESAAYPGRSLAGGRDGVVALERSSDGRAQWWRTHLAGPGPLPLPAVEIVSREIRPAPPLPPVTLELANTHHRELWVLVADRQSAEPERRLRIAPGEAAQVQFERDAGAILVEVYEIRGPGGILEREELVTRLPPAIRYDISVYERFLQSIAIDRTGKSPQRIEDVNYQPRSIGYFVLPPGDMLRAGRIDVYARAEARNNPGAVRRIDPAQWTGRPERGDPLEELLEKELRR